MGNTSAKPARARVTEIKTTAISALPLPPLSRDPLIAKLQTYYRNKKSLTGLLSTHEQPITDINLSIVDAPSSTARPQEEKESKAPKSDNTALEHFEKMHVVNHSVEVAEIFDKAPSKDGKLETRPAKHLLVIGAPGVGKTTMSQYIAHQWSIGNLWANKFDYLFWIPLRNLLQYPTDAKAELSLAHVAHRECFNNHRTISIAAIDHILNQAGNRTLLVLDGYDEVAHLLEQAHHPMHAILREAFECEYCMVTSRPYQLPSSDVFQVDRRLENTGFTDNNIESYVTRYFDVFTPPQPEKAQALLIYLKNNLSVWGTAHIPINLALICEIWQTPILVTNAAEGKEEIKPATASLNPELSLTGLYQEMTLFLLERHLKRQGKERGNQPSSWVYTQCQLELQFLSRLAFEGLCEHEVILTPKLQNALAAQFPSATRSSFDKILDSGFLRAADSPLKKEIDRPHYFIHLTFQEYLAAYHLVSCLKQDSRSAEYLKAIEWLRTEKYNPRYQVVLGFMAGLLSLSTDTAALQHFWKILLSEPFDLTGTGHIRLMISCLEEARGDNRIPHHPKLLEEVGTWFWISCNHNERTKIWVIPRLRTSPWLVQQQSTLTHLLNYDEKTEPRTKIQILTALNDLDSVAAISQATPILLRGLYDKDKEIKNRAAYTLGNLDPNSATLDIIEALLVALHDENHWVRNSAAHTLGKLNYDVLINKLIEALLEALGHKDVAIRTAAIDALGQLGSKAATPLVIESLLAALRNEDENIKSSAALALGQLGAHASVPKTIAALQLVAGHDTVQDVRLHAIYALVQLDPHAAILNVIKALQAELHAKNMTSIDIASILYETNHYPLMSKVFDTLIAALHHKNVLVRRNAMNVLIQLNSHVAMPKIITILLTILSKDNDPVVRHSAIYVLKQYSSHIEIPKLIDALLIARRDKEVVVRSTAINALGELGNRVELSKITEALQDSLDDHSIQVRIDAIKALVKLGVCVATPKIIELLLIGLHNENTWVKINAIETLGKLGSHAATHRVVEELLESLRSQKDEIKIYATEALCNLGLHSESLKISKTLLIMLQAEKHSPNIYSLGQALDKFNLSKHLHNLGIHLLQSAISKKVYFSSTPLEAFISVWLASRLQSLTVLAETSPTQHTIWLEIVAALAFYRAIPITLGNTTIYVYEGSAATTIPLPVEHAPLLKTEMLDTFANQAHQFGLPQDTYIALQAGKLPFPFEPLDSNTLTTTESKRSGISASSFEQTSTVAKKMLNIGRSSCVPEQLDLVFIRQEQAFCECLEQKIVPYVKTLQPSKPKPKCFISYAWGDPYYEYKIEQLALHLEKAGFDMLFDRWQDRRGKELTEFVEKLTSADFVLVVGTENYLSKYQRRAEDEASREHVVRLEARLINHLVAWSSKRSEKIIPLLFEGTAEQCFPPLLLPKSACDFVQHDYFQELLKLIGDLYGIDNRNSIFQNFVTEFSRRANALASAISKTKRDEYKEQILEGIRQQEAKEDAEVKAWLAAKATSIESNAAFVASLPTLFLPAAREKVQGDVCTDNKESAAAQRETLLTTTSSSDLATAPTALPIEPANKPLTLKAGNVTAGKGIYRLVLTANPTLASNDMHAITDDIKEIVIDMHTPIEAIKTVMQSASTLFSSRHTRTAHFATSSASSSEPLSNQRPTAAASTETQAAVPQALIDSTVLLK